ncbi:MAG TPA: hypothetical protein VMK13_15770 [Streptosporangiaceae bacterium]|nr:hypothetical protein [Streptosporangiaceae bacterium]
MTATETTMPERVHIAEDRDGHWAVDQCGPLGDLPSCIHSSLIFSTRREAQEVANAVNEAYRTGMAEPARYGLFGRGALADGPERPPLRHWRVMRRRSLTGDHWLIRDSAGDVALVMSSEASAMATCAAIEAAYGAGIARRALSLIHQSQEDAIDATYGPRLVQP